MPQSDETFFSVSSQFTVLLDPIPEQQLWLDPEQLLAHMPQAFQLFSQANELEQQSLPLLQELEVQVKGLAQYLQLQSQKVDLVLQQQLLNDAQAQYQGQGTAFGGSNIELTLNQPLTRQQPLAIRLFFPNTPLCIYAHGEVTACQQNSVDGTNQYQIQVSFSSILASAQEQLVRTSLHIQQQQLRQRAQRRKSTATD